MSHVIAAISTPAGAAGLGVVRLSGDDAVAVAAKLFRPIDANRPLTALKGYTAAYGHVYDADGDVDDCVALVFRAPHSYTGEDVVELSCHGGRYILQRVLRACFAAGARPAAAGEFTRRAFLSGKMDLTGAESVMDLISAEGKLAAQAALTAREGGIFRCLTSVKEGLLGVAAQFSAYIDYPDEDIPDLDTSAWSETVENSIRTVQKLLATYDTGRILREGVDTAIVGRPNVGKSTLMNLLSGCERSIVTDIAGTTRDIVEETVRLGDVTLRLADTAGIRDTADIVENVGVSRARAKMEQAALVLAVFDGSEPLAEEDTTLADALQGRAAIAIINKADKPLAVDKDWIAAHFPHVVTLSAKEHSGVESLTAAVASLTGIEKLDAAQPILSTERQRQCAADCLACLREAQDAITMGLTPDAVSVSVDGAINALLELTGERATEAVVEQVFARFCVGK
ncbi:MAG: tRNA uridine-5-carboxymethylaminomethyl(34) synthesis GTPase MnmE [Clostridia bacterium]|nr:tRNA uridine-5-carboxymethylaminomethyl(34) synthesis GTPase MnmE [Clostridia bacterium]